MISWLAKLKKLFMKNNIILICKDLNNKKIINKFASLSKEFKDINFSLINYQNDKSYDNIINFLPSWIININNEQDIVEGDVLIAPLRSLIKEKIRKVNYVKSK